MIILLWEMWFLQRVEFGTNRRWSDNIMGYYTTDLKLRIRILVLGKIIKVFEWHNYRWKGYFIMKEFNKWYKTLKHLKSMDKTDRSTILLSVPIEELEDVIALQKLERWYNKYGQYE